MWSATIRAKIQCFDINADNRMNLVTVWKVLLMGSYSGLVGFSDFQRKPRFGSKIVSVLSLLMLGSANPWLLSQINGLNKSEFFLNASRIDQL